MRALLIFMTLGTFAFSQKSVATYSKMLVQNPDSSENSIISETNFVFAGINMIIQSSDKRICTYLVPGSEFDDLDFRIFQDLNTQLDDGDTTSTTVLYGSIDIPYEIAVKFNDSMKDTLIILRPNRQKIIFIK
jgi:hypothetical protein